MLDKILNSPVNSEKTCGEKLHVRCLAGSWINLFINYFRKTFAYLFTNFD